MFSMAFLISLHPAFVSLRDGSELWPSSGNKLMMLRSNVMASLRQSVFEKFLEPPGTSVFSVTYLVAELAWTECLSMTTMAHVICKCYNTDSTGVQYIPCNKTLQNILIPSARQTNSVHGKPVIKTLSDSALWALKYISLLICTVYQSGSALHYTTL